MLERKRFTLFRYIGELAMLAGGLILLPSCLKFFSKPKHSTAVEATQLSSGTGSKTPQWLYPYPEFGRPITLKEYVADPLSKYGEEEMYLLKNSEVVIADYAALRRDFAFPNSATNEDIDNFLLDNFAVLSSKHIEKNTKGVSITPQLLYSKSEPLKPLSRPGLRPVQYGRAHLIPVDPADIADPKNYQYTTDRDPSNDILFDIKGSGALDPKPLKENDHGNGLMFLYEGMREYTYQKIAELIFQKESGNENWATIPTYAVLDLGFEILLPGGFEAEAGLIVRRSHFRLGEYSNASAEPTYERLIESKEAGRQPAELILERAKRKPAPLQVERILAQELALRKYGFTSTSVRFPFGKVKGLARYLLPESALYESENAPVDLVNIQVSRTMEVIDFGPYNFMPLFKRTLVLGKPQDENPYGGGRTGRTPEYWVAQVPVADSLSAIL